MVLGASLPGGDPPPTKIVSGNQSQMLGGRAEMRTTLEDLKDVGGGGPRPPHLIHQSGPDKLDGFCRMTVDSRHWNCRPLLSEQNNMSPGK